MRRQGRKGSSEITKFPTLEVRNPTGLTFSGPVQGRPKEVTRIVINNLFLQLKAFAAGPVYRSSNELSTKDKREDQTDQCCRGY